MKKFSLVISFTIFALLLFVGVAAAATVTIESSATSVKINDAFNLNVYLSDSSDLYGASVDLIFDPALVQVVKDGNTPTNGENAVEEGQVLPARGYVINQFNNSTGTVNFSECLIGNVSGVNVINKTLICTIPLKAVGNGTIPIVAASYNANLSNLSLNGATLLVHLSDSAAQPISFAKPQEITIKTNEQNNASLSSLTYNGTPVEEFNADGLNYDVLLPAGTTNIPEVDATVADANASINKTQAISLNGSIEQRTATITVTAEDGTTKVYQVTFTVGGIPLSNLAATPGDGQVILTFTAPTGASSVSLMQKSGGESFTKNTSIILNENSTSVTVTGLTNSTVYTFKLVVVGGAFEGSSNEVPVTPTAVALITPPSIAADSAKPQGSTVNLIFSDSPAWRAAITSITVDGTALTTGQYTVTAGNINIAASILTTAGNHTILVTATGYTDATVNQTMLDNTSPSAPTVSGVTEGKTYSAAVTPSWTDVAGTSSTATLDGVAYTNGTAVDASGSHTLVVTVTKTANGLTAQTTVNFTVNIAIPVKVIDITVTCTDKTIINGGTLQMSTQVLPENASDPIVTWSVIPGTGSATINLTGLLTAKTPGTVSVKATANDGSGVVGSTEITITEASEGSVKGYINLGSKPENGITVTVKSGTTIVATTNTDAGGLFNIALDDGTYSLVISNPGYLTRTINNVIVSGDEVLLSPSATPLQLWAGDVNGDSLINISDLTSLLNSYNTVQADPSRDFNGDGMINMSDLTSLLHDYNKTSADYPVWQW